MNFEQKIISSINHQFKYNDQKNLFYYDRDDFVKLAPETINFLNLNKNELLEYFESANLSHIVNYLSEKALEIFLKSNQYLNFEKSDAVNLKNIYNVYMYELFYAVKNDNSLDSIVHNHYERLVEWLRATNSFIESINLPENTRIPDIVCAEYSAELQTKILEIDLNNLMEPVLDIGCGENGTIVKYLRSMNKEAYGMDRLIKLQDSYFIKSNWFEYKLQPGSWGTIICNMSFTNHFVSHHLRSDGEFGKYAEKYMEILNSLKIGGKFHYAPGVPFIEQYLPRDKYLVDNKFIEGRIKISRTVIKKIA
jgi:hypothetical protein